MTILPTIVGPKRRLTGLAALSFAACAIAAATVARADVQLVPQVTVGVAHTDNLTLTSENEEPQTVYELIPSFMLSQESTRVATNLLYRIEGYHYRERDANDVYHLFDGNLRVAADPDNFFFDMGASRDQTIRDPNVPVSGTNLPITSNRLDRDQKYFGPELTYPLGENMTADAGYRHTSVHYHEHEDVTTVALPYDLDDTHFSFDNYRKLRGFTWATRYSSEKTNYPLYPTYEYRQAAVELGSWVGSRVRIFGSGGKESAWDKPLDPSLADPFWEVGFATRSNERFSAELAAGERSFGSSHRGKITMTFGHGAWQLEHSDAPTTRQPFTGQPELSISVPGAGQGQGQAGSPPTSPGTGATPGTGEALPGSQIDLLTTPSIAERYRLRSTRSTFNFDLQRTTFSMFAYDETREDRVQLDGTPLPDENQKGVGLSVLQRFGTRTSLALGLGANETETEQSTNINRKWKTASLTANYELGPRTRLSAEYDYTSDRSEDLAFGYSARLISVSLTRTWDRDLRR